MLEASANREVAAVVAVVDSSAAVLVVVVAPESMVLSVVAAKSSSEASLTETAAPGPLRFFLAEFWKACRFCDKVGRSVGRSVGRFGFNVS